MNLEKINVVVPLKTNARHLQQLFTGLEFLARDGRLSLTYDNDKEFHHKASIFINIDGLRVYVDCSDSPEIHDNEYGQCDLYFKRTLRREDAITRKKLRPFGLYFEVYPSFISRHTFKRFLSFTGESIVEKCKTAVKLLDTGNRLGFMPRESLFFKEQKATPNKHSPKVLFYVRLWDPESDKEFQISDVERADREKINYSRIKTIRLLKEKFEDNALVGVMDDDYSRRIAPDLIIDKSKTSKLCYLAQVNSAAVCIASTGLHGSIGAKFAEYVALGKAIVTESFDYSLPGELERNSHYLEYNSPDKCVEQVSDLFNSPRALKQMETLNIKYSQQYLSPEKIVTRMIQEVHCLQ